MWPNKRVVIIKAPGSFLEAKMGHKQGKAWGKWKGASQILLDLVGGDIGV